MFKYWIFVDNKPINGGLYADLDNAMAYARVLLQNRNSTRVRRIHIEKYDMTNAEKQSIIDMDDRSTILADTILVTLTEKC